MTMVATILGSFLCLCSYRSVITNVLVFDCSRHPMRSFYHLDLIVYDDDKVAIVKSWRKCDFGMLLDCYAV
ncbi:hypothetical protein D8674_000582 [Pyrus ussuriensis x Pyrus communis]|uniref:Secreted protein n=1 Tax=Pyrus ussuriensis x Pyrus communis TaxID=2448454 RepID=A0A5N5F8X8_9ROSA|nr:hypothetical protein D8674_000582 [Pyrus ussuriensis x Pyrus communis]